MTITQKFIKKNSVEMLSLFCGGHAVYAKTVHAVGNYTLKGFIKILMRNVERQGGEACKTFGGWRRLSGRGERLQAGAFGQRGKRGRL